MSDTSNTNTNDYQVDNDTGYDPDLQAILYWEYYRESRKKPALSIAALKERQEKYKRLGLKF